MWAMPRQLALANFKMMLGEALYLNIDGATDW